MKRWVFSNPNVKGDTPFDLDDYDEWVRTCDCGSGFWVKGDGVRVDLYGRSDVVVVSSTVKEAVDGGVYGVNGDGGIDWPKEKVFETYKDLLPIDGVILPDEVSCRILDEREVDREWLYEKYDDNFYRSTKPDRWSVSTYETGNTWQCKGRNRVGAVNISSDDDEVSSIPKRKLKTPKKEQK